MQGQSCILGIRRRAFAGWDGPAQEGTSLPARGHKSSASVPHQPTWSAPRGSHGHATLHRTWTATRGDCDLIYPPAAAGDPRRPDFRTKTTWDGEGPGLARLVVALLQAPHPRHYPSPSPAPLLRRPPPCFWLPDPALPRPQLPGTALTSPGLSALPGQRLLAERGNSRGE